MANVKKGEGLMEDSWKRDVGGGIKGNSMKQIRCQNAARITLVHGAYKKTSVGHVKRLSHIYKTCTVAFASCLGKL